MCQKLLALFGIFCLYSQISCYQKVYFDQITQRQFDLKRNDVILLKSSNQTKHLKNGVNATIVFHAATPGDRILIQTHTFATVCSRIKFYIYDGPKIDKQYSLNGPNGTCGVIYNYQTYHSTTPFMTLNFVTSQMGGDPAGGFNWTVLAYHSAPCGKDELRCATGRCYPNPALCDRYLSCSDDGFSYDCIKHTEETLSIPIWVVAVVVVGVVFVIGVTVTVVCLVRRKRMSNERTRLVEDYK